MRARTPRPSPWYAEVGRYEWLMLIIASAGWMFDAFEGQIFNLTSGHLLADLLGPGHTEADILRWRDVFLAVFLVGGTTGGVLFGSLADRFGRKSMMSVTILLYSVFSGLTYFATSLWHIAALRFLVALGVGGEWAVAATLVAEVFPATARIVRRASSTPRAFWEPGWRPSPGWPSGPSGGTPT